MYLVKSMSAFCFNNLRFQASVLILASNTNTTTNYHLYRAITFSQKVSVKFIRTSEMRINIGIFEFYDKLELNILLSAVLFQI
jgi:hypothetical protein